MALWCLPIAADVAAFEPSRCIDEWESAKWWDETLPSWLKEKKEENPTIKPVLR